jgi:hypothetical protein
VVCLLSHSERAGIHRSRSAYEIAKLADSTLTDQLHELLTADMMLLPDVLLDEDDEKLVAARGAALLDDRSVLSAADLQLQR